MKSIISTNICQRYCGIILAIQHHIQRSKLDFHTQCVSNLILKDSALFSNNGRFICTPIVLLYSTSINWNPQINHSCSLGTFQEEFKNMTFRAKYKQQTDKKRFPLTDLPYYFTQSRVTANQHFLSQALAFQRSDVIPKNFILLSILHSLVFHQVI